MSLVKKQVVYAIWMKKETAKAKELYFIATDKKVDMGSALFHSRGYWTSKLPDIVEGSTLVEVNAKELKDVWIPWGNISYIENLTYVGR